MPSPSTLFRRPLPEEGEMARVVIIPVRYFGYIPVLLWVWIAAWVVVEFFLGWGLVRSLREGPSPPQSPVVLALLLGLSTLAGIFLVWRTLWVSRGREIVELTQESLTVRRLPGGGEPEQFERSRINHLRIGTYSKKPIYPSWGRQFVGKEECFISFEYDGKKHEFARGARRRDAEAIARMILNN